MARITAKMVNERVDVLRSEFDQFKGSMETQGLSIGEQASQAGQELATALVPMFENIDKIAKSIIDLEERMDKLELKKKRKWKFW